jgi:hypothetical protein
LVHGKPLNGKLTCGENIADLGGLKLAFRALASRLGEDTFAPGTKRQKRINGFTPQQRFFLAWAQVGTAPQPTLRGRAPLPIVLSRPLAIPRLLSTQLLH